MASTTNVVITGANRGLGKAFVKQYLARPNHIVIGSVRKLNGPEVDDLRSLPTANGSKLILVKIESASTTDPFDAVKELQSQGIDRVDIVIPNAGITGPQMPMERVDPEKVADVYLVNAVGPTYLFLALKPLMDKSAAPKWMAISSAVASLTDFQKWAAFKMYPYNASKAALNHFTKTIHVDYPHIVAFSISPGFMGTDMGQAAVIAYGLDNPQFEDVDDSARRLVGLVDEATREKYSGLFVNYDGEIIPY